MTDGNAYELKKKGWYHAKASIYYAEEKKTLIYFIFKDKRYQRLWLLNDFKVAVKYRFMKGY